MDYQIFKPIISSPIGGPTRESIARRFDDAYGIKVPGVAGFDSGMRYYPSTGRLASNDGRYLGTVNSDLKPFNF